VPASVSVLVPENSARLGPAPHRADLGFSLIEAIVALTIFGMAIVVAAGFLDVHMSAARRLEARSDLVRAAETVLESVRGGTLPLVSGGVDLSEEFQPLSAIRVRTRVEVTTRQPDGLFEVQVRAWAMVRTEDMVVSITSQVWRP
jgi:prepilin-type N-terminal cleavage/methylation domain-containing protein